MKFHYLLALLLIFAPKSDAQSQKQTLVWPTIELDAGNLFTAPTPFYPLYQLQDAAQKYPRAPRFRVQWRRNGSHDSDDSVLIYNRAKQMVVYENTSQWWPDPMDTLGNSKAKGGSLQRKYLRWNRVTPQLMQRLWRESNRQSRLFKRGDLNTINDCDELIERLTQFGAHTAH